MKKIYQESGLCLESKETASGSDSAEPNNKVNDVMIFMEPILVRILLLRADIIYARRGWDWTELPILCNGSI